MVFLKKKDFLWTKACKAIHLTISSFNSRYFVSFLLLRCENVAFKNVDICLLCRLNLWILNSMMTALCVRVRWIYAHKQIFSSLWFILKRYTLCQNKIITHTEIVCHSSIVFFFLFRCILFMRLCEFHHAFNTKQKPCSYFDESQRSDAAHRTVRHSYVWVFNVHASVWAQRWVCSCVRLSASGIGPII